jgi:hypothetical protein
MTSSVLNSCRRLPRTGPEAGRLPRGWDIFRKKPQIGKQTRCTSPYKGEVGEQSEHRKSGLPDLRT